MGLQQAAKSIKANNLTVTGLCRGGFFTAKDWRDDNLRAIEEAHELDAQCLVLVVGGLPPGSKDLSRPAKQIQDGIADDPARGAQGGVPLAIEPLHPMQAAERACVNTLEQALDICDALGEGIGVAVDVYHVWWDPKLEQQIKRAGKKRILALSHLRLAACRRATCCNDRGMMGDGVIDLPLHPLVGRRRRLLGLPGGGDLLRARLVEARSGRGSARLQGATSAGLLTSAGNTAWAC